MTARAFQGGAWAAGLARYRVLSNTPQLQAVHDTLSNTLSAVLYGGGGGAARLAARCLPGAALCLRAGSDAGGAGPSTAPWRERGAHSIW